MSRGPLRKSGTPTVNYNRLGFRVTNPISFGFAIRFLVP
jgi:hypothetical protein